MSRLLSISYAIKDRLETIPGLEDCVVIYTHKNFESEFNQKMNKVKGKCVLVDLLSARNTSKEKLRARYSGVFAVSLFIEPALNAVDAQATDLIIEAIAASLHGYWPASIPTNGLEFFECGDISFPDNQQYQVALIEVIAPRQSS